MFQQQAPAAWKFLDASRNRGGRTVVDPIPSQSEPGRFKRYHGVPTVELPAVDLPTRSLGQTLTERCSCRQFNGQALALREVATLLHSAYGIHGVSQTPGGELSERPIPSGGARFPLEVYLLVRRVDSIDRGIYHYAPQRSLLEQLRGPVPWPCVTHIFLDQPYLATAGALMIITGAAERTLKRYGERGFRFLWLEAGHLAQNVVLTSAALDLGCLPLAGFYDNVLADLLGTALDTEPPLYALALGHHTSTDRGERRSAAT